MIHGLTFKEYIDEEKQKLSEMTKAEKKDYFKEYYLKTCIVAFICLILFIWFLTELVLSFRHVIVTGGVIGAQINEDGSNFLQDDYMEYLGRSKAFYKVNFAPYIILDENDPSTVMALEAELATNSYNYLISTEKGLQFVLATECLADLDEALDKKLKDSVSDRIVYMKIGESGEEIAAAIDITDTAFAKEYLLAGDNVYFILTGKAEDYEHGLDVLRYILRKTS
ncbi:MAG: hypothetical protein J6O17_07870 [Eubacterium sp.]|nr:hypothetical protein [Eubacterium sp.]